MRKTSLALAVAASTLGLSQVAFADFIGDSKANLTLRNFYFDNNVRNAANSPSSQEWGQGFIFNYQSGFTEGTVGFGIDAVGLLGVRLDGGGRSRTPAKDGQSRTPGALFPLESDGSAVDEFSKAGLTGKVRFSKTEARIGTLTPKLPILVSNDGRLLPQLFEGGQITTNEIDNLTLTAGQIERAVGRASSNSTGLSVAGGSQASNKFYFAGGDWKVNNDLTAQYYYANLEDYYKQHFAGLGHNLALGEGSLKTDLRYFRTTADGKNGNAAGRDGGYRTSRAFGDGTGEIDNNTWSAAFTYSLGGHALMLGYQRVSDDSNFVQLNQGGIESSAGASVYLLTDRLAHNFTRAGERTTFGQYSYDFASLGVPGLKASVAYLKGTNIQRADGTEAKEWERDLALDYVFQEGSLKGLGLGWRHGVLRGNAENDVDQNRLIVSYTIPLL
ncbi:MAG: OprD family porin [Pseudomonas sp.]|uniref:OprD family porin n=1 Tax=Pseudomonas sp. TaxID=306 RepID=UPI003D0EECF6